MFDFDDELNITFEEDSITDSGMFSYYNVRMVYHVNYSSNPPPFKELNQVPDEH